MEYRPEGLENPYAKAANELNKSVTKVDTPYGIHVLNIHSYNTLLKLESDSRIFEEAIDAMLEALRKDGLQVDISAGIRVFVGGKANLLYRTKGTPTGKGKLVFIPDDKETY